MTESTTCSNCGNQLPTNAPAGVCPRCLLLAGMAESSPELVSAETDATVLTGSVAPSELANEVPTERGGGSSRSAPETGEKVRYFGEYELLTEIARGGMGVVYRARQVRLNRIVALKMILAGQFAGKADVQRFHTEAEAAAQLDHPGIVPIYEVGEHDGHHFFTMGFVEGGSLASRLLMGPLAPRDAALLVQQIAEAVQYAHEHGVIHRDLKPANILLDRAGLPRISDFGLAKNTRYDSGLTASGQVMGTPGYMPPEQASGNANQVREVADVYSVGAILYALLTGRPPFQADTIIDTLMQVTEREPVAPSALNAKIPQDLETICLKCLEKDRRRRYPSARELADDLGRFLNGETIHARRASVPERLVKWSRRRPASAALIAVSVLATGLLAAGGAYFIERLAQERNAAVNARNDESIQRKKAVQAAKDEGIARSAAVSEKEQANAARSLAENQRDRAESLAYSGQLSKVQREWETGNVQAARDLLAACQWNLRGWEHDYLHTLLNHRGQRTIARHGASISGIAISPDGKRLASCGNHNRVKVWDLETGAWMFDVPVGDVNLISNVVFSPDGTRLACNSNRSVLLIDAGTGAIVRSLPGASGSLFFSRDGRQLATHVPGATARDTTNIGVWNLESGKLVSSFQGPSGRPPKMAIDPAMKRAAGGVEQGMLKVWDATDGRELLLIDPNRGEPVPSWKKYLKSVAFSPDGETIATGSATGAIRLWNAADGREVKSLRDEGRSPTSLVFSADGRRLAHGEDDVLRKEDNFVRVWDVESGTNVFTFRGHSTGIKAVAIHPDGRRVASAGHDDDIKLWELEGVQSDKLLPAHSGPVSQVLSSGDGRLLVTSGAENAVKLWDVRAADQLELRGTIACDQPPRLIQLSHDGRRLASVVRKQERKKDVPLIEVVTIWDVATQTSLTTLSGHEKHAITCLALSPDGEQLATGDGSGVILVRDTRNGKGIQTFKTTRGYSNVRELGYSSDGRWLAFAGQDNSIRIWDRTNWREVHHITPRPGIEMLGIAFSPDSRNLIGSTADESVHVWDVATGSERYALRGHLGQIQRVTFSPDGRRVVGGDGQALHVWDAHSGQHLLTFMDSARGTHPAFIHHGQSVVTGRADGQLQIRVADHSQNSFPLTGHSQTVNKVAYSPNGLVLATAGDDGKVKLYDTMTGIELHTLGGRAGITAIAFNADSSLLASCGFDKTVRLWEVSSGREQRVLTGHTQFPKAVAFRPDGNRLVSGDDDSRIFVWDVTTGETVSTWKAGNRVLCLVYSPDGRRVASSGYDFNVTLWDDATGERVAKLTGHVGLVLDVAFSPDGRWIASSGADSKVMLWNAATGEAVPSPGGHSGYVYSLAFSADSRWLATAGMGKQVHLWDITTNRELVTFRGHPESIMGVAFHPNGRQLTSVGYGYRDGDAWGPGTVRVWNIPAIDPDKTVEVWPD